MNLKPKNTTTERLQVLIEPLESRLLFSAEHLLGIGGGLIPIDDLEDDQYEDRRIAVEAINDQIYAAGLTERSELLDTTQTVAFVDLDISGADQLIETLEKQSITVERIETGQDGVEQISERLQHYSNLESVQI